MKLSIDKLNGKKIRFVKDGQSYEGVLQLEKEKRVVSLFYDVWINGLQSDFWLGFENWTQGFKFQINVDPLLEHKIGGKNKIKLLIGNCWMDITKIKFY